MSEIKDYIATVTPAQKTEFERICRVVKEVVPSAEEGMSYAMAAFKYKGKPFLSFIAGKKFLSLYPFSGKVVDKLGDKLKDFECTSGSIHFSEEHPVPEPLLKEIILARLQEIDEKTSRTET